jgi:hypothetical protein
MSSYIDPKNQTLLWNLIHKNPLLHNVFPPNDYNNDLKNNWFKNIISQIYSTLPKNMPNELLLEKNKQTLLVMNNELKKNINASNNQSAPIIQNQTESIYSRNQPDHSINNDFQQRQKEYEMMMKKPVVEEISFKENSNDGVIKNMDELIQQQLRERENDLERISKTYLSIQTPPKLNINENIPEKELYIVDLNEKQEKKSVSWGTPSIIEYNHLLETKIDELNKKYDDLMDYLKTCMPDFITNFSNRTTVKNILYENIDKIEK